MRHVNINQEDYRRKKQWQTRRVVSQIPHGEKRWDQAFRLLLLWSQSPPPTTLQAKFELVDLDKEEKNQ
jgi:hypothetical protein